MAHVRKTLIRAAHAVLSAVRACSEQLETRQLLASRPFHWPLDAEFQINSHTTNSQNEVVVAMNGNGGFVTAWSSEFQDGASEGIYAQLHGADGLKVGSEFRVNSVTTRAQRTPSIAMDPDGDFIVAWTSDTGSFG